MNFEIQQVNNVVQEEITEIFRKMIDDIVLDLAPHDPELVDGINWLDYQGRKEGLDFYQICKKIMSKHDAKDRANTWMKTITRKTVGGERIS